MGTYRVDVGRPSQVVGYQESQIFATIHSLHWAPEKSQRSWRK